jgi:threonyl-tRNA synthetase
MIHRALFGSVERFMAILIEHYAGNMPTWMSPDQLVVLGVRDDHDGYAHQVAAALRLDGVRVSVDAANEPLGARIRRAKLEKVPYILVVGDDDVAARTVGINARGANDPERGVRLEDFRSRLRDEIIDHGSPELNRAT